MYVGRKEPPAKQKQTQQAAKPVKASPTFKAIELGYLKDKFNNRLKTYSVKGTYDANQVKSHCLKNTYTEGKTLTCLYYESGKNVPDPNKYKLWADAIVYMEKNSTYLVRVDKWPTGVVDITDSSKKN